MYMMRNKKGLGTSCVYEKQRQQAPYLQCLGSRSSPWNHVMRQQSWASRPVFWAEKHRMPLYGNVPYTHIFYFLSAVGPTTAKKERIQTRSYMFFQLHAYSNANILLLGLQCSTYSMHFPTPLATKTFYLHPLYPNTHTNIKYVPSSNMYQTTLLKKCQRVLVFSQSYSTKEEYGDA